MHLPRTAHAFRERRLVASLDLHSAPSVRRHSHLASQHLLDARRIKMRSSERRLGVALALFNSHTLVQLDTKTGVGRVRSKSLPGYSSCEGPHVSCQRS